MSFHNVPPNGFPDLPDVEELEAVQKDVQNLKTMKAAKADIAPEFSATSNYAVGDMVYHDGTLYKCTTVHEAAAWNADHFAAATVAGELSELNSNINGLLKSGLFSVSCTSGVNILERSTTTLIGGSFPTSSFNRCVFMVSNHATTQDAPNTIEVDGADTLIINAVSSQGLTVSWLDFSNVQTS